MDSRTDTFILKQKLQLEKAAEQSEANNDVVESESVATRIADNVESAKESIGKTGNRILPESQLMLSQMMFGRKGANRVHHHDTLRGGGGFYKVPKPMRHFNEEENSMHQQWSELFLDLIYVVVAARAGEKLSKALNEPKKGGDFGTAAAMFVITFVALFDRWESRFNFRSRFEVGDIFHKLLEVLKLLCIALGALHLDLSPIMLDPSTKLLQGFYGSLICAWVLDLFQPFEILMWSKDASAEGYAIMELQRGIITLLIIVGAFVAAVLNDTTTSMVFGAISVVYRRLDIMIRIWLFRQEVVELNFCGLLKHPIELRVPTWLQLTEGRNVPSNISFMIIRYGEWTVIMIGESVLQIILSDIVLDVQFYVCFSFSFVIAALIQLLHYSMEPNHADGHVAKRSAIRTNFWRVLGVVYSMLLIALGASFKLVLEAYTELQLEENDPKRKFLCIPLGMAVLSLLLKRIMHNGWDREFMDIENKPKKYRLWFMKLGGVVWICVLSVIRIQAWLTLFLGVVGLVVVITAQVLDSRTFGDEVVKQSPGQNWVIDVDETFDDEVRKDGASGHIDFGLSDLAVEDVPSMFPVPVSDATDDTKVDENTLEDIEESEVLGRGPIRKTTLRVEAHDGGYVLVNSVDDVDACMVYLEKWQRGLLRAKDQLAECERKDK